MNLDAIWSLSSSHFQYLRDQVDNFFVDDGKLVFLFETMPPSQLYSQTDLLVNLSLTTQNLFGAIDTLLNILSDFLQRIRNRDNVLLDEREDILDVHLVQKLLLKSLNIFIEHVQSK